MDVFCRQVRRADLIPVSQAPEPSDFNDKVRQPGSAFLAVNPQPSGRQWSGREYWQRAHKDLHKSYGGICAYCGSYAILPNSKQNNPLGGSSVDHFLPKSATPSKAYEWSNFRLCRARLNNHKGNHEDVLDPFKLSPGWFQMDFRTFLLVANPCLRQSDQDLVQATIDRLKLNTDNDYVNERVVVVSEYCKGKITFATLEKRFPFLAAEMTRQDFENKFLPKMSAQLKTVS